MKKGEVTTDNAEIQRIIKDYYEKLHGNKMDNLEDFFRSVQVIQEEIEIMNNPITSTEIETVIKNSQEIEAQDQMASQENSIKHLENSF